MSRAARSLFCLVSVATFAFLYLPIAVVVLFSFNSARFGNQWKSFTTHWYAALAHDSAALQAAKITAVVAVTSTLVATILGTLVALALSRGRFRGRSFLETTLMLPVILPDIVMAVALLTFFHVIQEGLGVLEPGVITMTLAHVTFEIPFVAMVVRARLAGLDPVLDEAAHDLGASAWRTFWHVKLPLIFPGIVAGALLALTLSIDDFVVSFFTTGPGATTLPILIYSSVKRGVTPEINALSTLTVIFSVSAATILSWWQRRAARTNHS